MFLKRILGYSVHGQPETKILLWNLLTFFSGFGESDNQGITFERESVELKADLILKIT